MVVTAPRMDALLLQLCGFQRLQLALRDLLQRVQAPLQVKHFSIMAMKLLPLPIMMLIIKLLPTLKERLIALAVAVFVDLADDL